MAGLRPIGIGVSENEREFGGEGFEGLIDGEGRCSLEGLECSVCGEEG